MGPIMENDNLHVWVADAFVWDLFATSHFTSACIILLRERVDADQYDPCSGPWTSHGVSQMPCRRGMIAGCSLCIVLG